MWSASAVADTKTSTMVKTVVSGSSTSWTSDGRLANSRSFFGSYVKNKGVFEIKFFAKHLRSTYKMYEEFIDHTSIRSQRDEFLCVTEQFHN